MLLNSFKPESIGIHDWQHGSVTGLAMMFVETKLLGRGHGGPEMRNQGPPWWKDSDFYRNQLMVVLNKEDREMVDRSREHREPRGRARDSKHISGSDHGPRTVNLGEDEMIGLLETIRVHPSRAKELDAQDLWDLLGVVTKRHKMHILEDPDKYQGSGMAPNFPDYRLHCSHINLVKSELLEKTHVPVSYTHLTLPTNREV